MDMSIVENRRGKKPVKAWRAGQLELFGLRLTGQLPNRAGIRASARARRAAAR